MGKFDGYLICTDIDGTIEYGEHFEDYAENYRAVKYFTQNGGRFTFTTGRYLDYLKNERFFEVMNAPACVFNGGIIYDYTEQKLIFENRLVHTTREIIEITKAFKDTVSRLRICHSVDKDFLGYDIPDSILDIRPIKAVFLFDSIEKADAFRDAMRELPELNEYYICKSWDVGVEFLHKDATKGQAVRLIKEYIGDIHTVIAIGDNENDLPMIELADIGVTVGNATDYIKQKADYVVKPCKEFAIKDLIEKIENGLIK